MRCNEITRFAFQKFSRRNIHSTAERFSNWRGLIRKELESGGNNHNNNNNEEGSESICIYRIPQNMLKVEPEAYTPQTISIGPYHYGKPHLQDMENLKLRFFRRLFDPNGPNGAKLDEAFNALESVEDKARQCYMEMEKIKLSRDEFLHMMMVDGSFIIQLLRDFSLNKYDLVPHLSRWKLPVIRREMVMLENQLPLFVLSKLFDLTDDGRSKKLDALALRFFLPMLTSGSRSSTPENVEPEFRIEHLLDLLRSSVVPKLSEKQRGKQNNMIYSVTELKKSGVKIKASHDRKILDIGFGNRYFGMFVKELTIPALHLIDHRGTMLRNIVAFEKCHERCKPDVTTWIFFFNRLINTEEDVALLHYKGVLNHSLGSDKMVAELINNVTKEMAPDLKECYLHKVVNDANMHFERPYARLRRVVMHNYVNLLVALSTFGAIVALCFTFVQTVCALGEDLSFRTKENEAFSESLKDALAWVFKFDATPTHVSHSHDNDNNN